MRDAPSSLLLMIVFKAFVPSLFIAVTSEGRNGVEGESRDALLALEADAAATAALSVADSHASTAVVVSSTASMISVSFIPAATLL